MSAVPEETLRLDKWLWFARFCKSRSIASKLLASGKLRLSGTVISKAHQKVRVGDVLTFPQGPHVRVVKVLALGSRRGPAPEARTLYEDLAPIPEGKPAETVDPGEFDEATAGAPPARDKGAGRPTKRERRELDRLMDVGPKLSSEQ